jgi:WD40 repeat protein/transcriptional regulator with XRE-family HTH domain
LEFLLIHEIIIFHHFTLYPVGYPERGVSMKSRYGERDYGFGATMLTLRSEIGLTQAELAHRVGVSRRAVGEWEAGSSYPKAEHLKVVIALAVKSRAFSSGNVAEEIRALWKAARQKVLLDELWLSALLSERDLLHGQAPWSLPHIQPSLAETMTVGTVPWVMARSAPGPRVDWGDVLAVPAFYGRQQELTLLSQWLVRERCRVVSILGMGGIGKSALAVSLMYQLSPHFEVVIFRSLRDAPPCAELLDECLQVLSPQSLRQAPAPGRAGQTQGTALTEGRISLLLSLLRKVRALIVLDNLESLMEPEDVKGHLRPGYEGYGQLLRQVAETQHRSCLLLTSREKYAELRPLESKQSPVRSLRLAGLDIDACKQIFVEKDVVGTAPEQEKLFAIYGGNPLALKIVAETIIDLFGGEIGPLLSGETAIFGSITDLLDEQFARLSALERSLLYWLAIVRESVTLEELLAMLAFPLSRIRVLEALDSLSRRSLIERGERQGCYTLQSVVLEYTTATLIVEASREIQRGHLTLLIQHNFSQATAREYVRQAQERLLITPLLADLQHAYLGWASRVMRDSNPVEEQLLSLLDQLREASDHSHGYGPANLITLLRVQRGHLSCLDLSCLFIRGVYLQGIEMHGTSLAGARISGCVLTEAINATWPVAISPDGKWWAAASLQGKVCIWEGVQSQTLCLIWQAHVEAVWTLAFSPDGRALATGGYDSVKLWDVGTTAMDHPYKGSPRGTLLWTGRQDYPRTLAFCRHRNLLASGGGDATVRLWDIGSHGACPRGTNVQTLTHSSQVYAVAFSPDGHLLASGCVDGKMRLWERQQTEPPTYIEILSTQTSWVTDLAFAPDGRTLVSAHWDRTVKLWEVGSLHLLDTLTELQGRRLAWSPDGRTLACCGGDKMIWLWDVAQGRCSAVLLGHTGEVYRLAFAPDSSLLLSGSADSTLRVWNVQNGQCLRVIVGYAVSLNDLGWSPDGTHLVSGGSDALVTIWDVHGEVPLQVLRDHTWIVLGVGWSPDGKFVVSGGWDTTLRLWDATSGVCVHRFEGPPAIVLCMAWSPDGTLLACGTYQQGVQVWDMTTRSLRWVGQPYQTMFIGLAWSPDGKRLAAGNDDGSVYLWEVADGTGQEQGTVPTRLSGHHGSVNRVVWSPDGKQLASGSSRGELFVWDVQSREGSGRGQAPPLQSLPVQTFGEHSGVIHALAWSHCQTGTVGIVQTCGTVGADWDKPSPVPRADPDPIPTAPTRSYSPYGEWLISGDSDGLLRWWDVQSGECVCMHKAHQAMIRSLRVSPDGRWLGSCGDDGAIRIWDLYSEGQEQGTAPPLVRTLRHNRPYERLNITGIEGLNEAQKSSLQALGAVDETATSL